MPIIHSSSVIWIAITVIAWVTQYVQNIWVVLFILSSFVSAVSYLDILGAYTDYLPVFMQKQIWSYTESERALEIISGDVNNNVPLYAQILTAMPSYFIIILGVLLIIKRHDINQSDRSKRLLTIFFAMSTMTNFLSTIPSVGRFKTMVIPFLVILWIQNSDVLKKYQWVLYTIPVVYAYVLFYWLRRIISVTELYLYIVPSPITAIKYLL